MSADRGRATPRPWRMMADDLTVYRHDDAHGKEPIFGFDIHVGDWSQPQAWIDADFALRAVNAHDEAVALLREAQAMIAPQHSELYEKVRAFLARTTEGA